MASDREDRDGCLRNQVANLLTTIVAGSEETRNTASESLSRLLVSKQAVVAVLERERAVGKEAVFVVSLRLDAARAAVQRAAIELCAQLASDQCPDDWPASVNWFIRRVDELSLGTTGIDHQGASGSVLHLFDAGHYRRGQRHPLEDQVIAQFEEAAARPNDEVLRNRAFDCIWSWARHLAFSRCRDPHLAEDVATETILSLLRGARSDRAAECPWSGIEVARRVRVVVLGPNGKNSGQWRGLLARVARRRELSFTDVSLTDDDVTRIRDDATARRVETVDEPPSMTTDHSELSFQAMRDHLDLCRQQIRDTMKRQNRRKQMGVVLDVVLDVLDDRIAAAQRGDQSAATFVVAQITTHWTTEPIQALPALANYLHLRRPRWITKRLLQIRDHLLVTGLLDQRLTPRAARPDDLRSMLAELEQRRILPKFARHRLQQQAILGVVAFWRCSLESLEARAEVANPSIQLPPLFRSRCRLCVVWDVLNAIMNRLNISRNAAHNAIKRQLSLLSSWGMVDEIEDMGSSD